MSYFDGKLGYDVLLDRVYIERGTVFGETLVHWLQNGERIMIKKQNAWTAAILRRDLGGWFLESRGIKDPRRFEGRRARARRDE